MSDTILIKVTGKDKPGLVSSITTIMADYGLEVLDIDQSVIHDILTLGVIVRLPDGDTAAPVLKALRFYCHRSGLKFNDQPVSLHGYEHRVLEQDKNRYILTLLSRKVTVEHIARVSGITASYGLNIDHITRLSGCGSLNKDVSCSTQPSCLKFSVQGSPPDLHRLQKEFLHLGEELDIDVVFQKDSIYRHHRRLVVFDMDSTLIEAEVIDLLAEAAGVGAKVAEITERAMQGEIDFDQSFCERLGMLKGLDESVLATIAEQLPLTEGAEYLIQTLRALGYRTAILSGGFTYFANYLKQTLGIDYVYANELDIVNGKVTGQVFGDIVNGQRKADLLKQLAAKEGILLDQVIAVGDGANDLPMLSVAGLGIAFRAKPRVKQSARHAISTLGLDSILYLLGLSESDLQSL